MTVAFWIIWEAVWKWAALSYGFECQRSLSALQLLWKGIGAWVVRHPQYKVLFGPVSISSEYRELSRHLMAMSLEENYFDHELADLIEPKDPFTACQKFTMEPGYAGGPWEC